MIIYFFRGALTGLVGVELGLFVMIVAVIGGLRWMQVARLVRAQILSIREKEFIEAARALGAAKVRQVVRHILPNALGPGDRGRHDRCRRRHHYRVRPCRSLASASRPTSRAGAAMLFDAKDTLDVAPHWAMFSGAAIFITVLAINFIGDGLRDALDPRRVL